MHPTDGTGDCPLLRTLPPVGEPVETPRIRKIGRLESSLSGLPVGVRSVTPQPGVDREAVAQPDLRFWSETLIGFS